MGGRSELLIAGQDGESATGAHRVPVHRIPKEQSSEKTSVTARIESKVKHNLQMKRITFLQWGFYDRF